MTAEGRTEVVRDVGWDGMGWGMSSAMIWGWLFFLLVVVGVVVLVVLLVRLLSGGGGHGGGAAGGAPAEPRGRAREILDERYARGEIDAAEYAERLRVLRDGR